MKSRIFIGSSTESVDIAYAIQENLAHDAEPVVWTQGVFDLSKFTLESLVTELQSSDFAVFVFAPTDVARIRGTEYLCARDNVVFELGLFIGKLGRERCFLIRPRGCPDLHLPSDFAGLTLGSYDTSAVNVTASLGPCCNQIRRAIRQLGRIDPTFKRALKEIIEIAVRLSALRAGLSANDVRGFLHRYNAGANRLDPFVMFTGIRRHPDAWLPIPCSGSDEEDWYIISKAFRENRYLCEDVDWANRPPQLQGVERVWMDLNAVAVHPIIPLNMGAKPIGTICCDSSKKAADIGWHNDNDLRDILALLADAAYGLLTHNG